MKKRNLVIAAAAIMSLSLAACGTKTDKAGAASASEVATESNVEDPEIKKLEEMTIPEIPKLEDMGMIKMGDLADLTVEVSPKLTADDAMVDSQIDYLLEHNETETDKAAQLGDVVNIDFVGKINGKEFDGGKGEKYDLELGSGQFIPGFEDQLVGMKKGEKKTISVTFPENYQSEELKGKPATFDVTVNVVKTKPELSDEWIQKNAEKIESKATDVASFRKEQKELLQEHLDAQYKEDLNDAALQAIVDKAEIGISDEMRKYAEAYVIVTELNQAKQYGVSVENFLQMYGLTAKEFEEQAQSMAAEYAKQRIIFASIAKEQNITATEENINALVDSLNKAGQEVTKTQLIERFGGDEVKDEAIRQAVFRYITSKVKVVEKTAEERAAEAKAAQETEVETEVSEETEAPEETTVPETVEVPKDGVKANAKVTKVKG